MTENLNNVTAEDGAPVPPEQIPAAVTAATLIYTNGATQSFDPDGTTHYTENGHHTKGTWSTDDTGHFSSFWPPSYQASYHIQWIVHEGRITGLRFSHLTNGTQYEGHYQ